MLSLRALMSRGVLGYDETLAAFARRVVGVPVEGPVVEDVLEECMSDGTEVTGDTLSGPDTWSADSTESDDSLIRDDESSLTVASIPVGSMDRAPSSCKCPCTCGKRHLRYRRSQSTSTDSSSGTTSSSSIALT